MELANGAFESRDVNASAHKPHTRELIAWIPLIVLPAIATAFRSRLVPWQFMWALCFALFFGCKWQTCVVAQSAAIRGGAARNLGYLLLWPGMDARTFLGAAGVAGQPRTSEWFAAMAKTIAGSSLLLFAARRAAHAPSLAVGWIGMIGIVLALHFGIFHLLALAWRQAGIAASQIMRSPLRSTSLGEFWGKRWNLGFRQLTHVLVFQPVRKKLGVEAGTVAAFVVSGLIHDLAISFPAGGGYGLPTCYFLAQGIGVLFERSTWGAFLRRGDGWRGWIFTLVFTGAPAFWLFHPPFVRNVMLPFLTWIGRP